MKKSTAKDLLKEIESDYPELLTEFCLSCAKAMINDAHVEINFNDNHMPQIWIEVSDYEFSGGESEKRVVIKKPLASVLNSSQCLTQDFLDGVEGEKQSKNFRELFSRWTKLFTPH